MDSTVNPTLIAKLGVFVGSPEAPLRLLISILLGYPLAIIHRKFVYGAKPNIQHAYFFLTGLSLGYFNFGCDIFHSFAAMLFTYITLLFLGGSLIAVAIVFIFNMTYLLLGYYYVGTNTYDINWTLPQCVMVLRLIGLAFDVYDGSQPIDTLSAENKKVALAKKPTILETCGHTFFPPSCLVGPQFPMKRYQEFVGGEFSDEDRNVPPNSVEAALKRFLLGAIYLSIFQLLGIFVSDDYILSDDFDQSTFLKKCLLLGVWGRFNLYKYISCWLLAEGSCIMFGLTYNGVDANGYKQWNGLENVKVAVLENATEFNHYIQSFNINTNNWVAQYVYKRLKFLGNRHISQAAALLFLAIWHGFHSGYYVCFAFEFLVMYLEKDLKPLLQRNETLSNLLSSSWASLVLNVFLRLYTFVFMGWCLLPFALLTYDRYWRVYGSVYYMGFIFFGLYPILYGPILRKFLVTRKRSHQD